MERARSIPEEPGQTDDMNLRSAIAKWKVSPLKKKKRGGQVKYTDFDIESYITLGLVYKQRLRQNEGFVESIMQ